MRERRDGEILTVVMLSWGPIRPRHDRMPGPQGGARSAVNQFLDSLVCWREACEDVRSAYERWGEAEALERALAFQSYRSALGREEQAAYAHRTAAHR